MKEIINQRLKKWIDYKNISQTEFGKNIGKTRGEISNWCTGKAPIPDKTILLIIELFPEMNARWFITGEGLMLYSDPYKPNDEPNYSSEPIPPFNGKVKTPCTDPVCIAERDKLKDEIINLLREINEMRKQEGGAPPGKRVTGGMEHTRPTGTDG